MGRNKKTKCSNSKKRKKSDTDHNLVDKDNSKLYKDSIDEYLTTHNKVNASKDSTNKFLEQLVFNEKQINESNQLKNLLSNKTGPFDPDKPLMVNSKQYKRILIRREERAELESLGLVPKKREKFLYASRRRHALLRNRSKHGQFGTGENVSKILALKNIENRKNPK